MKNLLLILLLFLAGCSVKKEACKNLKISEEFTYILYFGIIREYKGLDILINSFAKNVLKNKVFFGF